MAQILIIEDDESNRRILEMTVQGMDFQVCTATNGEEGFEILCSLKPDLVILDVMMPKMSGLDTLRRIRDHSEFSDVSVLVVSAKAAEKDKKAAYEAGADEFITKPFHVKTIQESIIRLLNRDNN